MTGAPTPSSSKPLEAMDFSKLHPSKTQPPPFSVSDKRISEIARKIIPENFTTYSLDQLDITAEPDHESASANKANGLVLEKMKVDSEDEREELVDELQESDASEDFEFPLDEDFSIDDVLAEPLDIIKKFSKELKSYEQYRFVFSESEEVQFEITTDIALADFIRSGDILILKAQHRNKAQATAKVLGMNPQTATILIVADKKWSNFISEFKKFQDRLALNKDDKEPIKEEKPITRRRTDEDDTRAREKPTSKSAKKEKRTEEDRLSSKDLKRVIAEKSIEDESQRAHSRKEKDRKAREDRQRIEEKIISKEEQTRFRQAQENTQKEIDRSEKKSRKDL